MRYFLTLFALVHFFFEVSAVCREDEVALPYQGPEQMHLMVNGNEREAFHAIQDKQKFTVNGIVHLCYCKHGARDRDGSCLQKWAPDGLKCRKDELLVKDQMDESLCEHLSYHYTTRHYPHGEDTWSCQCAGEYSRSLTGECIPKPNCMSEIEGLWDEHCTMPTCGGHEGKEAICPPDLYKTLFDEKKHVRYAHTCGRRQIRDELTGGCVYERKKCSSPRNRVEGECKNVANMYLVDWEYDKEPSCDSPTTLHSEKVAPRPMCVCRNGYVKRVEYGEPDKCVQPHECRIGKGIISAHCGKNEMLMHTYENETLCNKTEPIHLSRLADHNGVDYSCICRPGFYRDVRGECVGLEGCQHTTTTTSTTTTTTTEETTTDETAAADEEGPALQIDDEDTAAAAAEVAVVVIKDEEDAAGDMSGSAAKTVAIDMVGIASVVLFACLL